MDDLINRKAAIDALKGLPTWWADEGGYYGGAQPPMVALLDPEDAVSAIENLPSAQPATNCSEIPNSSDDTINRQAAIDALDENIKHFDDMAEECRRNANIERNDYMDMRDDAAEYRQLSIWLNELKWLRERFQLQPEQHWIPVSERLPENDNEVLITVWDAEDDYVEAYKGFYQGHEWWTQWCHGCSKIKDEPCGENIVIAWMPLPASYKGE